MAKALAGAVLVAAIAWGGVVYGYNEYKAAHEARMAKALQMCTRPAGGTAFVAYSNGSYHCFFRRSQYPYRVLYSTIVMNGDDE